MSLGHGASVIRNGLIVHLDAANRKSYSGSGTTWTDLSGNANNGTLVDDPTFNTNIFSFDGLNDRAHLASPSDKFAWTPSGSGLNNLSVEFWIKTADTGGNIISKPWNGNGEYNYRLLTNSIALQTGNQSFSPSITSLATNIWSHIVFILTPTQVGVYKNGLVHYALTNHGITNNTPTNGNNNVSLCIMSLYPYGSGWAGNTAFSVLGDMQLLRIYNRQLSLNEIQQNFNALKGRYNL